MTFRIRPELLDCSIYLYPDDASARAGERVGGSGFMITRPFPEYGRDCGTLWAVTNRHVIEKGNWSIRINTEDGGFDVIDTDDTKWIFHPDGDDLAVLPLMTTLGKHKVGFLSPDVLLTKEEFDLYDIGPGDPCFVIGRFISQEGRQRNAPTARFGQIAQSPTDTIDIEGFKQASFLVEIRSIGGFSGSPVLVYFDTRHFRRGMKPIIDAEGAPRDYQGNRVEPHSYPAGPWLLGVDWCNIQGWERVCDHSGQKLPTGLQVPANTGMMGVVPGWRLRWLLLECPAVAEKANDIEQRALAFKAAQANLPTGKLNDR